MTPYAPHTPAPSGVGLFASPGPAAASPAGAPADAAGPPPAAGPPEPDPRHLLGLAGMPRATLVELLDQAARERERLAADPADATDLAGAVVVLAFAEDSTRTRVSFEIAARRLGAHVVAFAAAASSLNKGETLLDTLRVFEAMGVAIVVVRHPVSGTPAFLARQLAATGVVNAGDGTHEHPTQGLLDLLTLRDAWQGRFEGRRLAIVGDIAHSRVARSAIAGLRTLGATVRVCGPGPLIPAGIESLGCDVAPSLDQALAGADAVMALRIQNERMERGLLPSLGEYARLWGLTRERLERLAPHAVVLHPGPVNRGVELAAEVADSPRARILVQVANGVAVRVAVLRRCHAAVRAARARGAGPR